jgi:hypothetical protein
MLNARRACTSVGSTGTEEAPWGPQGKLASNVGSRRSSRHRGGVFAAQVGFVNVNSDHRACATAVRGSSRET